MNLRYYYRGIFKGILPALIIMIIGGYILSRFMGGGWIMFLLKVSIMLIIYVFAMLSFGMNRYEKKLCLSLAKKITKKR